MDLETFVVGSQIPIRSSSCTYLSSLLVAGVHGDGFISSQDSMCDQLSRQMEGGLNLSAGD